MDTLISGWIKDQRPDKRSWIKDRDDSLRWRSPATAGWAGVLMMMKIMRMMRMITIMMIMIMMITRMIRMITIMMILMMMMMMMIMMITMMVIMMMMKVTSHCRPGWGLPLAIHSRWRSPPSYTVVLLHIRGRQKQKYQRICQQR